MSNYKTEITLRGHHLLCLQGYQGYGYSEDFKKNIENILYKLENKNTIVSITNSKDELCKHCPNLKNNLCTLGEDSPNIKIEDIKSNNHKVVKMDNIVIKKGNIHLNNNYNIHHLYDIVNEKFKYKKQANEVCGDCIWKKHCLWYQSRRAYSDKNSV